MSVKIKIISAVIALVVLASGAYFLLKNDTTTDTIAQLETHQFQGNLTAINGNTLTVQGVYWGNDKVVGPPEQTNEVEVEVTEKTVITREAFKLPKNSERGFSPGFLPKETTIINLSKVSEDFKSEAIGLTIEADSDIYNKGKFTATKITYLIPIR